jgi:nucleotide-binding universal stress UspA family protein
MRIRTTLVAVEPASPGAEPLHSATRLATAARARLAQFPLPDRGVPAVEVAHAAERARADLIVLAREPRAIAAGVVRRARVPCLLIPVQHATFGRILAAIDAGPNAREVLQAATALGALLGGAVTALHVEAPVPCAPLRFAAAGPSGAAAAVATAGPMIGRDHDPVAEILRVVRAQGIDLLVHGHHRGGPANGDETGSVAARLLEHAPCAVLTVPI